MTEFIRVRMKGSGTEQTIPKPRALNKDAYEVLDEGAADSNGRPFAPKFPAQKADKPTGQKAATEKETN